MLSGTTGKSGRKIIALAAAAVVGGLAVGAQAQSFVSSNRTYIVSNGDDTLRVYSGTGSNFGSYEYAMPLTTGATQRGFTFDHQNSGAFYVLEDSKINVYWEGGSGNFSKGPSFETRDQSGNLFTPYDIAYMDSELYVTRRNNSIYVYNAYTGAFKRQQTISGGNGGAASQLQGIEVPYNYDSGQIVVGDYNKGAGGYLVNRSNLSVNSSYFWGGQSGPNPIYNNSGYWYMPSRDSSGTNPTSWWAQSSLNTNYTTGGHNSGWNNNVGVIDSALTNSGGAFMLAHEDTNTVSYWNNSRWDPGRTDQVTVNDPASVFFKYNSNPGSPNPIVSFTSLTGLNDIVIDDTGTSTDVASGTNAYSTADDAVLDITDLLGTRLASGDTNVRSGSGSSNVGDGTITLDLTTATEFDYGTMATDRTLSLRAPGSVIINDPIVNNQATAVSLSLELIAGNESVFGTAPTTGDLEVNADLELGAGAITASGMNVTFAGAVMTTGDVSVTSTGTVDLQAALSGGATSITAGTLTAASTVDTGDLTVTAGSITTGDAVTATGDVSITSTGASSNMVFDSDLTSGGTLDLTVASGRTIDLNGVTTASGNVTLTAPSGRVTVDGDLDAGTGAVTVTANNGAIRSALTADSLTMQTNIGSTISADVTVNSYDAGSSTSNYATLGNASQTVTLSTTEIVGNGNLVISTNGVLDIDTIPANPPIITLAGGRVVFSDALTTSNNFKFNAGTLEIEGAAVTYLAGLPLADKIVGTTLSAGKAVETAGQFTVASPLTLAGGRLSVASLQGADLLSFSSGTLELKEQNLSVAGGSVFGDTLVLGGNQNIVLTDGPGLGDFGAATVESDGIVELAGGRITASSLTNEGDVRLGNANSRITASSVGNAGILQGTGRVEAEFTNLTGGEVRVDSGNTLRFLGTSNANNEFATIDIQGGEAEFAGDLINGGDLIVNNGRLRAAKAQQIDTDDNGFPDTTVPLGVYNTGRIAIEGVTKVYGDIYNYGGGGTEGGEITISNGATVSFYNNVVNGISAGTDHEFTVSGGSAVTFFGDYSGGEILGQGTALFEGETNFGYSPASLNFGGSVVLGDKATMNVELAGYGTGEFDQINVASLLSLDGDLNVLLLDGFTPEAGDSFTIATAGQVVGGFNSVSAPWGEWAVSYAPGSVTLTAVAVPEPATLGGLALAAAGLIRRRRRA